MSPTTTIPDVANRATVTRVYERYAELVAIVFEGRNRANAITGRMACTFAKLPYGIVWPGVYSELRGPGSGAGPYRWLTRAGHRYFDSRAEDEAYAERYANCVHGYRGFHQALRMRAADLLSRDPQDHNHNWWDVAMQYNTMLRQLDGPGGSAWWRQIPLPTRARLVHDYVLMRSLDDHLRDGTVASPCGPSDAPDPSDVS